MQSSITQEERQEVNNNEFNAILFYSLGQEKYDIELLVHNSRSPWFGWQENGPSRDKIIVFLIPQMMRPYGSAWPLASFWPSLVMWKEALHGFLQWRTNMHHSYIDMLRVVQLISCLNQTSFLCKHPFSSGIWQKHVVKKCTKKTCVMMRMAYVLKTKTPYEVRLSTQHGGLSVWQTHDDKE